MIQCLPGIGSNPNQLFILQPVSNPLLQAMSAGYSLGNNQGIPHHQNSASDQKILDTGEKKSKNTSNHLSAFKQYQPNSNQHSPLVKDGRSSKSLDELKSVSHDFLRKADFGQRSQEGSLEFINSKFLENEIAPS
jgi:hypothetical protein